MYSDYPTDENETFWQNDLYRYIYIYFFLKETFLIFLKAKTFRIFNTSLRFPDKSRFIIMYNKIKISIRYKIKLGNPGITFKKKLIFPLSSIKTLLPSSLLKYNVIRYFSIGKYCCSHIEHFSRKIKREFIKKK